MTIYNIQVLRAFAAVSIVIVHTLLGIHSYEFQSFNKFNLDDFGVDIFFVISGFIMVFIQDNYKRNSIDFFIQRVKRILPIYWICNFTILLSPPNRSCKSLAYFSQSVISISATPLSIAAFATAGEMVEINLGSKGFGIM